VKGSGKANLYLEHDDKLTQINLYFEVSGEGLCDVEENSQARDERMEKITKCFLKNKTQKQH
jgi:hypothetical protein